MPGPLPVARAQVADGLKLPVLFDVNVTLPVGVVGVVDMSITRAVQVVPVPTMTEPGMHVMLVCVGWAVVMTDVAARLNEPELDV